ncbi:MAG TPA: hypothetical protein V6C84_28125 [Coleofasciculaceae cyanobacterium]
MSWPVLSVTVAELEYGVYKSRSTHNSRRQKGLIDGSANRRSRP